MRKLILTVVMALVSNAFFCTVGFREIRWTGRGDIGSCQQENVPNDGKRQGGCQ